MKHNFGYSLVALIFFVCLCSLETTVAQSDATSLFVTQDATGLKFYAVGDGGVKTQLGMLPTDFLMGLPDNSSHWFIDYQSYLTPSPDHTLIAFTAQQGEQGGLFLYSIAQNQIIKQVAIPICLKPVWSPDSAAILLTIYCGEEHTRGGIDYVYDLASDQLHALDSTADDAAQFQWLADSSGFLYEDAGDLFTIAREGDTAHPLHTLTNLRSQTPEGTEITICDPVWSAVNQRYYYVVGCIGGADIPYEYIFSVDLAGNNRNESIGSLPALYPTETLLYILGIHPNPNKDEVYITLESQDASDFSYSFRLRILRLHNPGEITTVYEAQIEQEITSSLMSPNGDFIALLSPPTGPKSEGVLKIINLGTGQITASVNVAPNGICSDAQWLGSAKLLYAVDPDGYCDIVASTQPIQLWQFDISSGVASDMTENVGRMSWLLPVTTIGGLPVVTTPTPSNKATNTPIS